MNGAAAASGDGDGLADRFTADGTYDDYFFGPSTGRDAIKRMLAHFSGGRRNFRWEFYDPVRCGAPAMRATASATTPRARIESPGHPLEPPADRLQAPCRLVLGWKWLPPPRRGGRGGITAAAER
ncbi:MAG: nuclear transport factor 2 family protein [Bradyrhizobiaceae bacterium]|nr:nuclear transport factor 2 family protein [Bradyrhizobiaceae bacterium]